MNELPGIDAFKLLNEVKIIGHPFHGLVVNGSLTLPNSDSISYNTPSNATAFAIQLAGVPAVERTEAEAEFDSENGFQWLSKVVLSGTKRNQYGSLTGTQIYGKVDTSSGLGTNPTFWLWRDSNGIVWKVEVGAINNSTLTLTTVKFGRFGEGAATEVSSDYSHGIDDGTFEISLSGRILDIIDINADGSKAILAPFSNDSFGHIAFVKGSTNDQTEYSSGGPSFATMGFVLVELADGVSAPTITVTTLKNYSETLGTLSADYVGYNSYAALPGADWQKNGSAVSSTTITVTDRVISMYFSETGIKEVTADYQFYSGETEMTWGYSPTFPFGTIPVTYDGSTYYAMAKVVSPASSTVSVILKFDGVTIDSVSRTYNLPTNFESFGVDGTFFSWVITKGGTYESYYEAQIVKGSAGTPPDDSSVEFTSLNYVPRLIAKYTPKLFGVFWVELSPLRWVWSDAYSVYGGTADAPSPSTSWTGTTMTSNLWNRSLNPLTNEISDQYSLPVCFV